MKPLSDGWDIESAEKAFPDLKPLHEALALLPATFDRSTSRQPVYVWLSAFGHFFYAAPKRKWLRELPERVEEDIRCAMEGEQEKLYRAELKLARQSLLKIKTSEEFVHERFFFALGWTVSAPVVLG
jgi:SNF2 family DNA or RNA helicase